STANSYHHRLNTGGNRKANSAIYTMAIVRAKLCKKTQAFIEKKMAEGKSKKDAIRILKRYLAREVYDALKTDIAELNLANSTS
ncbi:MAG: IS110 family transposase, partial [Eggerthellaceae bacterium]|nr:IS110 family transposase [Eggerthellaceae bacterium]MCL1798116.1 IS110 family transposase [Eggerthellaceae bacterium]